MHKITVIGGGASGLVAAIYACNENTQVTLLERNESCAKKILVTGNGKCNYWNQDQDISHYHSDDLEKIQEIISREHQTEVLHFFDRIGIVPKIKNGYYYPFSNQAISVKKALLLEASKKGVIIETGVLVTAITKEDNHFIIQSDTKNYTSDKVILSVGSKAAPKTGSNGNGYRLIQTLGHTVISPLPALVQLTADTTYMKAWAGIRTDVKLSLYENKKKIAQQEGEIQLTDYGISGICTFNLSHFVTKGLAAKKEEIIEINFLPFLTESKSEVIAWFNQREKELQSRTIKESLEGILNYKLVQVLLKISKITPEQLWEDLSKSEQEELISNLISLNLKIEGSNSFEQAQVCSGGVPLTEIDTKTLESKKVPGLYLTGEILDVNGDCGGYNLGFAWMSGIIAGLHSQGE